MAYSYQSEVSDGTLQRVLLSIPFYNKEDVHVSVDGRELSEADGEYSWEGDVAVYLRDVVPAGMTCMLKRNTDMSKLRLKFSEGVAFTRNNLDDQNRQFLHMGQEAKESAISDVYNDIDMHHFRIRNAGDPEKDLDYTTKRWVANTYAEAVNSCTASALAASSSAVAAGNSAADANSSEERALASAIRAEAAAGAVGPQVKEALRRSYAEIGLNLVSGSFEDGAIITDYQDALLQSSTGKCFNWQGAIPAGGKVIPVGSTPESTGGIGTGKWWDVTNTTQHSQAQYSDGVDYKTYYAWQGDVTLQHKDEAVQFKQGGIFYRWDGDFPQGGLVIPQNTPSPEPEQTGASMYVAVLDLEIKDVYSKPEGASEIGFIQSGAGAVKRTSQDKLRERLSFGDHSTLAQTIDEASHTRYIDMAGQNAVLSGIPTNQFGTRIRNGKVLVPSRIAGFNTQLNTYADDVNGLMVARENLAAWWLSVTAGTLQTVYLFGDSTVETGGAYPVKPHELFKQALLSAGVNNCQTVNRGVSGTSWSDLNAIPDLGASTKLIVIKYGINDAVKDNPLTTFMTDARNKLAAIRANPNGSLTRLSILLMGPNSTYRPSTGQDAKWYESLRNCYLQLCKEFDCAYFDTYAYLQQTKYAPSFWMDNISGGEGLHPDPVAVYWIWREAIKTFVLGDGQWNISKANQLWNPTNFTRVAYVSTPPAGYNYGVTIEAALTANGWPFDGVIITTRHSDGTAVQNVYTQDVVPRTASRRGGGAVWTQWGGVTTAVSTFLNNWTNKGGGYTLARYTVGADGFVDMEGTLTGGAVGSSAFRLPANARPASTKQFATVAAAGSAKVANVTVFADGNVIVFAASNAIISLDGIRFRVMGS